MVLAGFVSIFMNALTKQQPLGTIEIYLDPMGVYIETACLLHITALIIVPRSGNN